MPSPRRLLAVSLIATSLVASVSWALVLLGAGGSHAASLRLLRGVTLVLHHEGGNGAHHHHADRNAGHHFHGWDEHPDLDPHADDHLVAVSTAPASLRSSDAESVAVVPCGATMPVASATLPDAPSRPVTPAARDQGTPHRLRATTVLLI